MELVSCARYSALITEKACERFKRDQPARCAGCRGHGGVAKTITREVSVAGSKRKECVTCGRVMVIVGRGLCGSCLNKALAEERAAGKPVRPRGFQKGVRAAPAAVKVDDGPTGPAQHTDDLRPGLCTDKRDTDNREAVVDGGGLTDGEAMGWLFGGEVDLLVRFVDAAQAERRSPGQQLLKIVEEWLRERTKLRSVSE